VRELPQKLRLCVILTDHALERAIAALIKRKNAAEPGSTEHRIAIRLLAGLRDSYKDAGLIIEDLDPFDWGGDP